MNPHQERIIRWPVYAIVIFIGLFALIVTALWLYGHLVKGEVIDQTSWIILGASGLRLVTLFVALASIQPWGEKIASWIVFVSLWAAASGQLAYPLAELLVKLVILVGLIDFPAKGVGNMTLTGWFNLSAAWLIFGLPGLLFIKAARLYQIRKAVPNQWAW